MKNYLHKTITFIAFICFASIGYSQEDASKILENTNVDQLNQLATQWAQEAQLQKQAAIQKANLMGWPISIDHDDGRFAELIRLDENGQPVYYITDNVVAALSARTNKVHSGGGAGLSLEGSGMDIGEWDGGAVRATHEQFTGGRVTQVDGATSLSSHATHVAGTIIADGIGTGSGAADAKGMAPQANLLAHDWFSDNAEMATAAGNGLLVSNHSYGFISGWYWDAGAYKWAGGTAQFNSTGEDPGFGQYGAAAVGWDNIAINAPHYLIFKSAGNERNDNLFSGDPVLDPITGMTVTYDPALHPGGDGTVNGGYDCIGDNGNAKNIMTVAAVNDVPIYIDENSVSVTSFTSWGPTDDGRIKPDISANGSSLWSSESFADDGYSNKSGTSMSSPSAAGSAILLQEHYENLKGMGNFMRSSTLKALIIHTADEAGAHPGPDYSYGWGLMNTEAAAAVITDDMTFSDAISENTLNENNTFTLNVTVDGTGPLCVTIAWLDPVGTATASGVVDDPTIKLVNDLDMTISNGMTYMPYILDPANPSNAATTGDNDRDNIEQIYIANPTAGTYTITVSHEGALTGGSQDFSMIISRDMPTVTPCPATLFAGGNGQDGNMFNVSNGGTETIEITSFETNLDAGAWDLEVYYTTTASSHIGIETNSAEWTMLGSVSNVTSSGAGFPTSVAIGGLQLAPGEAKGLYVTVTNGASNTMNYSNSGNATYGDGILVIDMSVSPKGVPYPFGSTFSPRYWNGQICYDVLTSCEYDRTIPDDPIASGTYQAENSITSGGRVADGGDVTLEANSYIDLIEDFEVEDNADFLAQTGVGCNTSTFNGEENEKSTGQSSVGSFESPAFQLIQQDWDSHKVVALFNLKQESAFNLALFDLSGQLIVELAKEELLKNDNQEILFDLSSYNLKGNYILKGKTNKYSDEILLNFKSK